MKKLLIFLLSAISYQLSATYVFASGVNIETIQNTPWSGGTFPNLAALISPLLSDVIVIASIILFVIVFVAGFSMITGAGESDPKKMQQGQQAITWAIAGFVVIFCAFWIIQIIKALTGVDIIGGGGL